MRPRRSAWKRASLSGCAFALVLIAHAVALASEPVIVAPLVGGGELAVAARDRLEARLGEAIRKGELSVVETSLHVGRAANACRNDECRASILRDYGARFLLVPSVSVDDQDYSLRLTLFGPRGQQIATLQENCGLCGLAEAEDVLADLGARVGRKIEVAGRACVLTVTSEPEGARVFVDGELVGTTPVEVPLEAGAHPIRVELAAHIGQQRALEVVEGEHQTLAFRLQRSPVDHALHQRRTKILRGGGWTSLALGVGMIGGGVALIVVDKRPITSDCSGENVDVDGNCRFRHATLEGGIGLAIGGAVLVGVAAALLAVARKRAQSQRASMFQAHRLRLRADGVSVRF